MIIVVGKECMGARFSFNQGYTSQHCVEYIHWIRKTRRMISSLKPMCSVHYHGVERVLFGGLCRERPLVGHEEGVLELLVKDNNWIPVFHENFIDHKKEQIRKYCVTNDAVVICGGEQYDNMKNRRVELLKFVNASDQQLTKIQCSTQLPIDVKAYHVLTNLGNNKILLIGGSCDIDQSGKKEVYCPVNCDDNYCAFRHHRCSGTLVFEGRIDNTKDDVIWRKTRPLNIFRISPIVFKMKNNVYVAGGKSNEGHILDSCERYNLTNKNWSLSEHYLPFPLNVEHASVVTSKDESEAMIFNCITDFSIYSSRRIDFSTSLTERTVILTFNDMNGFRKIKDFSTKIQCSNSSHITIAL